MLKKILLAFASLILSAGFAFAQVDVNKADQAGLDGVKGIGPKTSKSIVDERKKNGPFKDWADLEKRVNGIGDKSSTKLSQAGLTVNGESKTGVHSAADAKEKVKTDAKNLKENVKADSKTAKDKIVEKSKEAKDAVVDKAKEIKTDVKDATHKDTKK